MSSQCVRCGKPMAEASFVCSADATALAGALLAAAGHAEDAWTVIARQTRYGGAGGARKAQPEPAQAVQDARRNPVTTFGWAASVEKPRAGALVAEPAPVDFGALDRYHAAENTIGTWARDLESDAADLPAAARWLAEHVDQLRTHPAAAEAFDELHDACAQLERLVDSPPADQLVGMCDCGRTLYAPTWRQVVQCPDPRCKLRWDVERSRDVLREALRGKLLTAAEAARLAAYWDERTSDQIRKLVNKWSERGRLTPHGQVEGDPVYLFGDVLDLLAVTPRRERNREGAAA